MTDSPVMVTPIFDQLVAEFGSRNRTAPAQGPAPDAETPADETVTQARPGAAV